ncbi:MAG: homoserine dehydrogenase [Clostridia bacterium]|nr:homoserine dehydrogenase [Clostridia bacterium]
MKIALMGCGTVGRGVFETVRELSAVLGARCGRDCVEIKYILDKRTFGEPALDALTVRDVGIIAGDPEIEVVVEAMGGTHPAFEFCMACLQNGKSVVTSNKQLVAEKAETLFETAKKHNVQFRFGASVCGGIPVLRTMFYSMAGNEITGFAGILNGTTNFILTKMIREQASFDGALKQAQAHGYAEADPSDDIEGRDTCRKTAILASIAFGTHTDPSGIHTEGITGITAADAAYIDGAGSRIKLLGIGEKQPDGRIYTIVAPAVVPANRILADVEGVFNAVSLYGTKVGEIMLYGPGAGKDATASAVVADVLDCARTPGFDPVYSWETKQDGRLMPYQEKSLRLYVRGNAGDKAAALSDIREAFEDVTVLTRDNAPQNELAFITGKAPEKTLSSLLTQIRSFVPAVKIRCPEL